MAKNMNKIHYGLFGRSLRNRKILYAVVLLVAVLTTFSLSILLSKSDGDIRVVYSLDERKNDQEIINLIDTADEYIYFAIYYFTRDNIAEALMRAKRRGLVVQGITDREGALGASKDIVAGLKSAGVSIITQKHLDGIMHLKVLVTDKAYASGSYNWTVAATESNDEVLEIGKDDSIRKQYLEIVKKIINENSDGHIPDEVLEIGYEEASKHVGRYARVTGNILKVYRSASNTTFFNYCKSSKCPFSAVIFASDRSKFGDLAKYEGKTITVEGIVKTYNGKPEIIVNSPDQITMK